MDAEFVNAYIQKQKTLVNELMNKLLVAETQLEVFEGRIKSLAQENESLKDSLEKAQKKPTKTTSNKEDAQSF